MFGFECFSQHGVPRVHERCISLIQFVQHHSHPELRLSDSESVSLGESTWERAILPFPSISTDSLIRHQDFATFQKFQIVRIAMTCNDPEFRSQSTFAIFVRTLLVSESHSRGWVRMRPAPPCLRDKRIKRAVLEKVSPRPMISVEGNILKPWVAAPLLALDVWVNMIDMNRYDLL